MSKAYIASAAALAYGVLASAGPVVSRDLPGPTINFANNTGAIKHLASGILYGLPDNQNQIPSELLSGFGFNYNRGAGAQVGHGWSWSPQEYENRFLSAVSNYQLTRSHGGNFVILLNDLWGFDSAQNSSAKAPGDNGDWSSYDAFIDAVIADVTKNNMQPGLVIDIWNEPEGAAFWGRSQSQWLDMWGRGYHKLRSGLGSSGVLLSGPTTAGQPSPSYDWWSLWAQFVNANSSVPDQYVWHEEAGAGSSPSKSFDGLVKVQQAYGLPARPININEYAIFDEEVPAGSAFFIGQLERINAIGLRGNWLSGSTLHDLAASLLSKSNPSDYSSTDYFPNGDYQVYAYYAQKMTGHRVGTSVSADGNFDAYATVGDGYARILMGVRPPTTGTYLVTLDNLSSLGLPTEGTLSVRTWRFGVGDDVHYSEVDGPQDLGYIDHNYSGNSLVLDYYQTDQLTAFAWEFATN